MVMQNNFQTIIKLSVIFISLFLVVEPSFAASAGGGLPFDGWLTKLQSSVTGPFAFGAAIIGLVSCGATLIFGGDINGFMKTMLFFVLVLSLLVGAQNTLSVFGGTGALITHLPLPPQTHGAL